MKESYYRTGQAAKLLGVSSYHVRRLCEAGEIESEISAGQQWKIPLAEVARLKREGVPPVPVEVEDEPIEHYEAPEEEEDASPSPRVIEAADDVRITASRLEKRRLERESEEVEDWFRDRQRKKAQQQAAERQKAESAQREQRRQQWTHEWIAYALDSLLPEGTPREAELDVHASVRQALAGLDMNQPSPITKRIVAAAVEKALRPWTRKREIERAIESGMSRLAWEVRHGAAFAGLRQQAREAVVSAIRKAGEDAGPRELAAVAMQAVEPMMREYEHDRLCEGALSWIYVSGASSEEQEAAKEAAREAVAALPVGTSHKQIEQAKEKALAPFVAAVARREKADRELHHVERYLEREYEFDGGYAEMRREAERLRPMAREALVTALEEDVGMSAEEMREVIEECIDSEI